MRERVPTPLQWGGGGHAAVPLVPLPPHTSGAAATPPKRAPRRAMSTAARVSGP